MDSPRARLGLGVRYRGGDGCYIANLGAILCAGPTKAKH